MEQLVILKEVSHQRKASMKSLGAEGDMQHLKKEEEERNAYSYEMIEGTNLSLNVLYSDSHFKGNSGFKSRSGSF